MTDGIIPFTDIYCDLTPSQFSRLQKLTSEVHTGSRIASRAMLQIGSRLDEIKRILKQDKLWRYWCETEFENSHDTADRYIRAANRFASKIDIAANLQKSVLYYLTDEAPPEVAEIALERAKQGEKITNKVAHDIAAVFQKAAVSVLEEAIATQGTVTLDNQSVSIVEDVKQVVNAEGQTVVYGTISKPVLDAALAQTVAENLKADKDTVIRHIVRKGQNLGKVEFLSAGTLDDFQKVMKSGEPQQFDGQLYISLWGLPRVNNEKT